MEKRAILDVKMIQKGWLVIAKLKPLSLFISLLLMLKKAFDNREMKSENGFSLAIASQPFRLSNHPTEQLKHCEW